MDPKRRSELGARIATRVLATPELTSARTILLYASLPEEVPTRSLAEGARQRGINIIYPRCLPTGREMMLHLVGAESELIVGGRYGIQEPPVHCPSVTPDEIDLALIPGLGWDRSGHRLGRGAGYYDRLLASPDWKGLRCGIFFSSQEFPNIPVDSWDQPLDLIVTDREVVRFG